MKRLRPVFLTAELPLDGIPKEFRIWAFGQLDTLKGEFTFDQEAARRVMAEYEDYGNELSFDYEHQALKQVGQAPAAAWFNIELRNDGLWATNIRWTPKAEEYLANKEYRYFSPAFLHEGGRITKLVNIALTNIPATKNLAPLVAASAADLRTEAIALGQSFSDVTRAIEEALRERFNSEESYVWVVEVYDDHAVFEWDGKLWQIGYRIEGTAVTLGDQAVEVQRSYTPVDGGNNHMKTLLKALGLKEDANEAEALAALTALQGGTSQLVTLTGKATPAEAIGVLQAWKAGAEQATTLSARVAELEGQTRQSEVRELIEQGKKDGKVTPAMEAVLTSMGKENIATLTAFLEAAPKVAPGGEHNPPKNPQEHVTLSAEDKAVIAQMGIDAETYQKHKKAQEA